MKKIVVFCSLLFNCDGGNRQEIIIKNESREDIFYLIHKDSVLKIEDIESIRPLSDEKIRNHHRYLVFETERDSLENAKNLKSTYLVEKNNQKAIFTSRGVTIYNNSNKVQQQIRKEYNNHLHISTIPRVHFNSTLHCAISR